MLNEGGMQRMEKRKCKRSILHATVQLRQCTNSKNKKIAVEINDLSRDGLGFYSTEEFIIGEYYDTEIVIWTKEVLQVVIKIVRKNDMTEEKTISYGGEFVGLSENEKFRIDVYQCVEENAV